MASYNEVPKSFRALFHWHLLAGTRPLGDRKADTKWTNKEFARAIKGDLEKELNEKTVRNWRHGKNPPRFNVIDHILCALFGKEPIGEYVAWRGDLRAAYEAASGPAEGIGDQADDQKAGAGLATPNNTLLGALQWSDLGPSAAEIVRQLVLALEDRSVLYNSVDRRRLDRVQASIALIRELCTNALQQLAPFAFAVSPIRAIRDAARHFHDALDDYYPRSDEPDYMDARDAAREFYAFRATVGQQLSLLVAHHDINIEGDLARILPRLGDGED